MTQQQGLLTITGYVGGQPTQFNREGMPHASSFRLASTRHYFDGRTQQWKDLPTTWITVKAYRGLSESICQSFKKGEPVIVTGVLAAESWVDQNGKQQSKLVMEANAAWPVTRCARVAPVRATCRRRAARQTPCGTGPHYGRCRSYGIRRGSAGRSADTAPPTRRDS